MAYQSNDGVDEDGIMSSYPPFTYVAEEIARIFLPEGPDMINGFIYTNDSDEWLTHFTTENYSSILENIVLLHLNNPDVLDICQRFEQTTAPELGLRGKACRVFNM
ncbi:hypothetical protein FBU30_001413 [Linnemannia zychae]|nr:hypothetical protein FBU30_001413 [Linnemannia zychae]